MKNIHDSDVVLIQPSVLKQIITEDIKILDYFNAMSHIGTLWGDSPIEPNYGLLTIAQILIDAGFSVRYLDLTSYDMQLRASGRMLCNADIENILLQYPAKIYGVSYMTVTYGLWAKNISKILRKVFPSSYQIVGGIHPTMFPEQVMLDCPEIDYIVRGEAENIIVPLCNYAMNGSPSSAIPSVTRQFSKFPLSCNLLPRKILNTIPFPAYNLVTANKGIFIPRIYTARGCNHECNFCVVSDFFSANLDISSRYIRQVDYEVFESQLNHMLVSYNPSYFCIGDLSFAYNHNHALRICKIIKEVRERLGSNSKWWAQVCANHIDVKLATAMKEAGCCQIAIGVEGGTDNQRVRVSKKITTNTVTKNLSILRDLGLEIQTYWIIGLPGDDEKSVEKTIKLMIDYLEKELTHLTHISVLVPYPGTCLYNQPKQLGIKLDEKRCHDFSQYWMNCDPYGCDLPVYSTIDKNGKVLLSSERIYELWLQALSLATKYYKSKILREL